MPFFKTLKKKPFFYWHWHPIYIGIGNINLKAFTGFLFRQTQYNKIKNFKILKYEMMQLQYTYNRTEQIYIIYPRKLSLYVPYILSRVEYYTGVRFVICTPNQFVLYRLYSVVLNVMWAQYGQSNRA